MTELTTVDVARMRAEAATGEWQLLNDQESIAALCDLAAAELARREREKDGESDELPDYEDIVALFKRLPQTWCPALLIELAETAYEKNVFLDGGASVTIRKLECRIGRARPGSAAETEAKLSNAVTLVIRLARCLPRDHGVRQQALDWVERMGLMPSPLRGETP